MSPTITFVHNLKDRGKRFRGLYYRLDLDSNKPHADHILLDTYDIYLTFLAAHEFLHCYTHPNFHKADDSSDARPGRKLVDGTTKCTTRKVPVTRNDDTLYAVFIHDVAEETLKKAYVSGDKTAMVQVLLPADAHADLDKKQG